MNASNLQVQARVRGQHGTHPPIDELRQLMENWLRQVVECVTRTTFCLEVECARIPMKGGNGRTPVKVYAISEFSSSVVLVRMFPSGTYQWRGQLTCPTADGALRLFLWDKSAVDRAIYSLAQDSELPAEASTANPPAAIRTNRAMRRRSGAYREFKESLDDLNNIRKRENLRQICANLIGLAEQPGTFSRGIMSQAFEPVFGRNFANAVGPLNGTLVQLMLAGVIVPVSESEYQITELGREYAEEWNNRQLTQELQRITVALENVRKLWIAAGREEEGLIKKRQAVRARMSELETKETDLLTKKQELEKLLG